MTMNTKAIQAVIDACPSGGVVCIPSDVFVSGKLQFKTSVKPLKSNHTVRSLKNG